MSNLTHYGLPQDEVLSLLNKAEEPLLRSNDPFARSIGQRLHFHRDLLKDKDAGVDPDDYLQFLGTTVNFRKFLCDQQLMTEASSDTLYTLQFPAPSFEWGKQFLVENLREVRRAICEDRKESSDIIEPAVASLTVLFMGWLGISEPEALGVATLFFLGMMRVTRNRFCRMNDSEILAKYEKKSSGSRRTPEKPLGAKENKLFHLTKKGSEWRLERAGSNRALVKAPTKKEALQRSRGYLRKNGGTLRIHKENGQIQEVRTYSQRTNPRS